MKKTMLYAVAALSACGAEDAWSGKTVAFLGEAYTNVHYMGCTTNCRTFLRTKLGVTPLDYTAAGARMADVAAQAAVLKAEHPDGVDAIFVFAGMGDFDAATPLGEWFAETTETVDRNGVQTTLKRRRFVYDATTFCGCVNTAMAYLKANFPGQPGYFMTPVAGGHGSYANEAGFYADDYAAAVREAGNVWAVSVIDLDAEASAAAQTALPADLPFYREGCGTTNRAAVSSSTAVLPVTLDSRTAMSAASAAVAFDSDENRALILIIR